MIKNIMLLILFLIVCAVIGVLVFLLTQPKYSLKSSLISLNKQDKAVPSNEFKDYIDPAGFSFNYPDDISLEKNEVSDKNIYSDLVLFSKDVDGSINLKVEDTKITSLEQWAGNLSSSTPEEVKFGTLKALKLITQDRIYIGALDQGILFTLEMPLLEEDYWNKVSEKVLADFAFAAPEAVSAQGGSYEEVSFEGEEVVE